MRSERLSIILPCFDEEAGIAENVRKVHEYLSSRFENPEIIAVDDGSRDGTLSELDRVSKEIPLTIIRNEVNEGKGKAVKKGILAATGDIVAFLDADLAIPIEEIDLFVDSIVAGHDIVIASRFIPEFRAINPIPFHRRLMERVFRVLRKIILNNGDIQDTQCGFKVFRRDTARRIFKYVTVNRFAFDAELIFVARKFGYSVKELPIHLRNPRESHVRIVRDPIDMFIALFRIRLNEYKGRYDGKSTV